MRWTRAAPDRPGIARLCRDSTATAPPPDSKRSGKLIHDQRDPSLRRGVRFIHHQSPPCPNSSPPQSMDPSLACQPPDHPHSTLLIPSLPARDPLPLPRLAPHHPPRTGPITKPPPPPPPARHQEVSWPACCPSRRRRQDAWCRRRRGRWSSSRSRVGNTRQLDGRRSIGADRGQGRPADARGGGLAPRQSTQGESNDRLPLDWTETSRNTTGQSTRQATSTV